ncbi:MAG: hypothetical protein ACC700_17525 [Anaerolineales bacterium]
MSPKKASVALIWTGGGFGGALPGIPARDLTAEEVKAHGGESSLIGSRLYEKPKSKKEEGS